MVAGWLVGRGWRWEDAKDIIGWALVARNGNRDGSPAHHCCQLMGPSESGEETLMGVRRIFSLESIQPSQTNLKFVSFL